MEKLPLKTKRRAVTYGKASRKQSYGRHLDLDSEDESSGTNRYINGRASQPSSQKDRKALSSLIPATRLTTPPMSPSPSITSPSSSTGTKRTSPFVDDPSEDQKKKIPRTSRASSSSLEEMFPVTADKTRKPIPKLGSKKVPETLWSTSDDTQMLLDNQLRETSPPPAMKPPAVMKKASALKMPTRIRLSSTIAQSSLPEKKDTIVKPAQTSTRIDVDPKQAPHIHKTERILAEPAIIRARPKTPEKAMSRPSPGSVISPSTIELDALQISINRNALGNASKPSLSAPATQPSPKPSPYRVKLKDRMTSDLTDMVVNMDSSVNDISSFSSPQDAKKAHIPTTNLQGTEDFQPSSSQPSTQLSQLQGPKVTYGSARWTFLPDEDEEMAMLDPILDSQDSSSQNKISRQLPDLSRSSSNLAALDMVSDDDDEPSTTMRSLHELKRAGGSQRVNRQIEGLLDDIEHGNNKSQRIGSLAELILKLKQSSFLHQFLDAGAESRLLNLMNLMKDSMAKTLYCTAFLLILNSSNLSLISIGTEPSTLPSFFGKLLDQKTEVGSMIRLRNSNVSKDNHKMVERLFSSIQALSIWSPHKPSLLTPQIISLACLERFVRKLRETGNRDEVLSPGTVSSLIGIVSQWGPEVDIDTRLIAELSLSTLESASLAFSLSENTADASSWSHATVSRLVSFFTGLLDAASISSHQEFLSLVLRLCLNLSNGSASTSSVFCNINFIKSTLRLSAELFGHISSKNIVDKDLMLDNLVLSLGLLINLSEKTTEARDLFLVGETPGQNLLQTLLDLFKSRLQEAFEVTSEAEIRSNVPFGYLAVLLGYLCKSPAIFIQVRSQLEGGNLRLLLIAIGEFLQYHQKVEELRSAEGESEVKINFISRLQGLIDELRAEDSSVPAER